MGEGVGQVFVWARVRGYILEISMVCVFIFIFCWFDFGM